MRSLHDDCKGNLVRVMEWTYFTVPEDGENGAMVWSSVAVDLEANMVIATTGNNYTRLGENSDAFHAIDLQTGKRIWKRQVRQGDVWSLRSDWFNAPTGGDIDTDFGANPILADVNGRKLVAAGNKGSGFWALDRATGEVVWARPGLSARHSAAYGGVLMNGAFDGHAFYTAVNEPQVSRSCVRWMPKPATTWCRRSSSATAFGVLRRSQTG